jgi:GINS complex subunit 3|tara:strand:- start:37 stop:657 length:621 start_codon:yes stop_codon:yes gene_type:complete
MAKYFDVNSFLTEQETVPVVFNSGCTGLGKEMDKQNEGHDLPSYAEVMLPFWLVPKLFEQNMVAPSLPECFDERVWMIVHAEPRNVPIREFCAHFFRFGKALNKLLRDESLGRNLADAFSRRYKALLCQAHGSGEFKQKHLLAREEEFLFTLGRDSMRKFNEWKYATHEKIEPAAQVKISAKRRRQNAAARGKENETPAARRRQQA